ncbi:MAG: sensor domain-containing diguanylate cyclase [Armatimonadetes bacterium]|nr:sensor domain-containing diguanylate cyclase [Armatimonadota bacterium]
MTSNQNLQRLIEALETLDIQAGNSENEPGLLGFPCQLSLPDGTNLTLGLDKPGVLNYLDPESLGIAILDQFGVAQHLWGIANHIPLFTPPKTVLESELASIVLGAYRGVQNSQFLDGFRYHVGGINLKTNPGVVLLVTDASDEKVLTRKAGRHEFEAIALRKIGKALTMNQTLEPICYAAVHEIASVAELASALLWVKTSAEEGYELKASIGANRDGTTLLSKLHETGNQSCIAELVMAKRETFLVRQVNAHAMTAELEAKICYLKPGGMMCVPLTIGDQLIGVLELIARDGDQEFLERKELFETIAEHLSLALNSALLFESFERLATIDPLTGVANHRAMQDFLQRRISEYDRNNQEMGVIMLDVDHFRLFNEEEGHDAGDLVLKKVVEAIKSAIRQYDLAARYGGEEFTVILPTAGPQEMMRIAERIRTKIEQVEFVSSSGSKRTVTASLGCAMFPSASKEPQGILKAADIALYQAKNAGRNRCVQFEGELKNSEAA